MTQEMRDTVAQLAELGIDQGVAATALRLRYINRLAKLRQDADDRIEYLQTCIRRNWNRGGSEEQRAGLAREIEELRKI